MTWTPQSSNLKLIEMVWDKLDSRGKEKQITSAMCGNSFKTVGKAFQVKKMPIV
jgi:hypothetical protein